MDIQDNDLHLVKVCVKSFTRQTDELVARLTNDLNDPETPGLFRNMAEGAIAWNTQLSGELHELLAMLENG